MGVERPVHMCGAVKIDQNLLFFHTRGRGFVYQIAKNASIIKNHELGEIRMFVKCGGSAGLSNPFPDVSKTNAVSGISNPVDG